MPANERKPAVEPWRVFCRRPADDFCESVFFTGNGTLGVRGFPAWQEKSHPQRHAIFRAGLFEPIKPGVTDMVQLPDALTLLPSGHIPASFSQELLLFEGVVRHGFQTDAADVWLERMVSMADSQLICQRLTLTAKRAGSYSLRAVADSRVVNLPVNDDQATLNLETVPLLLLEWLTESGFALRTVSGAHHVEYRWEYIPSKPCEKRATLADGRCVTVFEARLGDGEAFSVEQRLRVLVDGEEPRALSGDPWRAHREAVRALWEDCDVELLGDDGLQGALRYGIYQMLCSNACDDPTVSIGARGLTHGRYKGNTFWDTDIFLFPFFLWQRPRAARSLAAYRLSRLGDARDLAKSQNLAGARYPWMCSGTGREQCESWDIGRCEIHITADVAYALRRYEEIAGDEDFSRAAAPVYLETARYWESRLTYEPRKDRYSLFFVKGPDEYCGVTINNTYTNYLARFNLLLGAEVAEEAEAKRLRAVADKVTLLYDERRELYLQDETFDRLEPAPMCKDGEAPLYEKVCYDRIQRYRVLKQADLVQLMTLFPGDFTRAQKEAVFHTYEPLTLHDSTLSYGVHALLAFQLEQFDKAMDYLRRGAYLDLWDVMGNTGREGVHMAALGAAWQAVVYGMAGLWSENGSLTLEPHLPKEIQRVSLRVRHRGKRYRLTVTHESADIKEE